MSALLLAPHNDDEAVFSFFQVLRHKPKVIVVLRSYRQWIEQGGPDWETREAETAAVCELAGVEYEQWLFPDHQPPWPEIADEIKAAIDAHYPTTLIAPAFELGGHEDHNGVASIVNGLDLACDVIRYLTYQRGWGRTKSGIPVDATEEERELKAQALGKYVSQRRHPLTADWFPGGAYADLGEWIA